MFSAHLDVNRVANTKLKVKSIFSSGVCHAPYGILVFDLQYFITITTRTAHQSVGYDRFHNLAFRIIMLLRPEVTDAHSKDKDYRKPPFPPALLFRLFCRLLLPSCMSVFCRLLPLRYLSVFLFLHCLRLLFDIVLGELFQSEFYGQDIF